MPFKWDFSQIPSLAACSSKYDCKPGGFIFLFQTNRPETGENRERSSYFFDFPTETVVRAELVETKRKKRFFFFAYTFSVLYNQSLSPPDIVVGRTHAFVPPLTDNCCRLLRTVIFQKQHPCRTQIVTRAIIDHSKRVNSKP